jgi:glycosyltransferase involved in cell wall biosynthesis
MKVLHVVEATTAGVGRHVLDLCVHLRRADMQMVVACPRVRAEARNDTSFVDSLGDAGIAVTLVPMRRRIHPSADLRATFRLAKLIRSERVNVVHGHSSKAGALARLAALRVRSSERPAVVYTPNAFAFLGARRPATRWLYLVIERWLGRRATDALVCVSRSEMSLAQRHAIIPPERLVLIENTIDLSRFVLDRSPAAKSRLGLDPTRPVVGAIGRLARQKGPGYLLRAARLLIDGGLDAQFLLVGEGELEGELRQMVTDQGLGDHVSLPGFSNDIPQVLAALDIFVLPSLYEGLPYTLMEAMAAGCAVVATDVGGNRDLVQHEETGLLIPPADANALAQALIFLLSLPGAEEKRKRLAQRAQSAARARPTPEQTTRQMIQLYRRLAEGRPASRSSGLALGPQVRG